MRKILNITNGDSTVEIMKKAGIPGEFLPWRDVLHEGPVPENLSLEALSEVRAKFISDRGWADAQKIHRSFIERDNVLKSYKKNEKVILWFEHDLYDQLQLIQILDWFQGRQPDTTILSLICTDQYLGMLASDEMASLIQHQVSVSDSQLKLAQRAWAAFREKTPEKWSALLKEDTSDLQFLEGAIVRVLEEFPNKRNGLSRTEQQALKIISGGEKRPGKIFGHNQKLEARMFLGDSSFWDILHGFLASSPPLITLTKGKKLTLPASPDQELSITSEGEEVLSGKQNWLDIRELDRWVGGVHLKRDNVWCWDAVDGIEIARA